MYKVEYSYGITKKLTDSIIADIMLSQVEYEYKHYQVRTEVIDHNMYKSVINKVNGFIRSINVKLHSKWMNRGWKVLL